MYIIEISPLIRGSYVDSLTYYSPVDYSVGALLSVPVRKKHVVGLVLSSKLVSNARAKVRTATFTLRRLPPQKSVQCLSPLVVATARYLAEKMPATESSILYSLLPKEITDGEVPVLPSDFSKIFEYNSQVSVFTSTRENRIINYKSRVREAFAHGGTVMIIAPTNLAANTLAEELSVGIIERTIVFTNKLTKKGLKKAYDNFNDLSESKLVITTPGHGLLDRPDITDVIIDEAFDVNFRSRVRPYTDYKNAIITAASLSNRRVLLGDLVHRTEDEYLRREGLYQTDGEHLYRIAFPNQLTVIKQEDKPTADSPFVLFSEELLTAMKSTIKDKKNVFVYSARRGLAPVVACGDCGYIFRCPDSGTPYSLLRTVKNGEEKRWFLSSISGRRVQASDTCPQCSSWRLRERGIGIQHIYDELKKYFSDDQIFLFDHTTASTNRKGSMIIGDFYEKKGAILLGTSMAISFLEKPVSLSAVVSLDAVRSIPTWRVDEETFALLLKLREKTFEELIVQTRKEADEIIHLAQSGKIDNFFNEEISLRQALHYPPFVKLVHLTLSGSLDFVRTLEAEILPSLEKFNFAFYSAPQSTNDHTIRYGLCRTKDISPELLRTLRDLPPIVRVEIDPYKIV